MSSPVVLRLEPHQIPRMRRVLDDALTQLGDAISRIRREGQIHDAWMGDPTSAQAVVDYRERILESRHGPLRALSDYRDELQRVRNTLVVMEENYRRTEGDVAELWGRT